jgi:hypothetical protein
MSWCQGMHLTQPRFCIDYLASVWYHTVFGSTVSSASLALQYFLYITHQQQDIKVNVHRSSCTVSVIFSSFNQIQIWSTGFCKNPSIKVQENLFSRSRVVPCRWIEGPTDMVKAVVIFHTVM